MIRCSLSLLLLSACSRAPTPDAVRALSVRGQVVGFEAIFFRDSGRRVERNTTLELTFSEEHHRVQSRSSQVRDDAGWMTSWSGRTGSWQGRSGQAWPFDLAPPPTEQFGVFDPLLLEVHPATATLTDHRWTVSWRDDFAQATYGHGAVPSVRWGGLESTVVDSVPDVDPADLTALLAHPTPEHPAARGAVTAEFLVDGRSVRVAAPLRAEIPAPARARLDSIVAEVQRRLDARPTPDSLGGAQALMLGRGDCTEHAEAVVHLAENAGLKARTVSGLTWHDGSAGPGLYPHTWAEVQVQDAPVCRDCPRWVAIDAILGQIPADATHLPLPRREVMQASVTVMSLR